MRGGAMKCAAAVPLPRPPRGWGPVDGPPWMVPLGMGKMRGHDEQERLMRGGRVGVHAGMSAAVRDGVPSLDEGISCALSAWHGHAARVSDIDPVARGTGIADSRAHKIDVSLSDS